MNEGWPSDFITLHAKWRPFIPFGLCMEHIVYETNTNCNHSLIPPFHSIRYTYSIPHRAKKSQGKNEYKPFLP